MMPSCVCGQSEFEVASVKPSLPDAKPQIRRDPAGGFIAAGITLKMLIVLAYNIQDFQLLNLSPGLGREKYDVIARSPAGAKKQQTWEMLQALLAERFKLSVHREDRETTVYAMVVSKKGLKIEESRQPPSEADDSVKFGEGHIACIKVPMSDLALALSGVAKHRVIDRTGVSGKFDVTLDWSPGLGASPPREGEAPTPQADGPGLFAALEDQLGLKLVPEKGQVEVVIVDHLERPTAN
jgi:uncharacterized protein (TIGR03435 family)